MENDELWSVGGEDSKSAKKQGLSAIRISILFASGAIALAVVATPMLAKRTPGTIAYTNGLGYDGVVTGSIPSSQSFPSSQRSSNLPTKNYTVRRSITQTKDEDCIIFDNGAQFGGC